PNIRLVAPRHGGHCSFIARERGDERFWCEARIVEFCREHSALAADAEASGEDKVDASPSVARGTR
ncbi:MAG: hypothetical protein ACRD5K_18010, partial [Candidatus Acidiferrales bacterium]